MKQISQCLAENNCNQKDYCCYFNEKRKGNYKMIAVLHHSLGFIFN